MTPVWMTDHNLDSYIELRLIHWSVNSPHDLSYWKELLVGEQDEDIWMKVGGDFLASLDIHVEKVRTIDGVREWLVWKLPYGC